MSPTFPPATYLKQLAYFEDQNAELIAQIAQSAFAYEAKAGEILFIEGEPSAGLWMIENGRVKVYKLNPAGQEHILHILGDNNTFNDISTLDGGMNPANAAALADSTFWVVPPQAFREAILRDSQFAARVIQVLSGRVRRLVGQIEDLTLYSVIVRVARLLIKQMEDPALSGDGVTRAALAAHLATTPQTISTALKELEISGAIAFNRHEIHIVDEPLLRSIALM